MFKRRATQETFNFWFDHSRMPRDVVIEHGNVAIVADQISAIIGSSFKGRLIDGRNRRYVSFVIPGGQIVLYENKMPDYDETLIFVKFPTKFSSQLKHFIGVFDGMIGRDGIDKLFGNSENAGLEHNLGHILQDFLRSIGKE